MAFPASLLRAALVALPWASSVTAVPPSDCVNYNQISKTASPPLSDGRYALPYQRPEPRCRTFAVPEVDAVIEEMRSEITDPDLFRLFHNTLPNTVDTTISWKGFGENDPEEETEDVSLIPQVQLAFIRTGDVNAMWLRDSANQLQSYKTLLRTDPGPDSLASLFRGAINLQGRYIRQFPYCNAFQPPAESGLEPQHNSWAARDSVEPGFEQSVVFECKYELDSLASFLQLSHDYFSRTRDAAFFGRRRAWAETVGVIVNTTSELLAGTYAADGTSRRSPFLFRRTSDRASQTMWNGGVGPPVRAGSGMARSFFRPSNDACVFQLFVPANMMLARYAEACAEIMDGLDCGAAERMRGLAGGVRAGVEKYGRVAHREFGEMYAYEVDGYGSHILMDDANTPSLLSAPMLGYLDRDDPVYLNTRRFILSNENPYFMFGPVINATGGPHVGLGLAWPMGLIVQLLTSDDDEEIKAGIRQLLSSTDALGLMHESIDAHAETRWTRAWFAWANGLFGQMILDLRERKPHLLRLSYQ